ncbi:phage major tail tube protein [Vibrio fluvialis]|uniref:phage major tail tube protein n=1 Tax=Vibrio fluvialis TaxID=676 RepID=UPI00301DE080
MAGQRTLVLQEVVIEGHKFMVELQEHTPPVVERTTEDTKGGRYVAGKQRTGVTMSNATLKIRGLTADAAKAYGLESDSPCQIDVKESYEDEDGNAIAVHYSYTGEINKIDQGSRSTQGMSETTLEIFPSIYKQTDDGKIVYDINVKTQYINLGDGDIMAKHRSNIGRA